MQDFTHPKVWQKAHDFTVNLYKITASFPPEEKFGLTNQIRRASVSIESNISEGYYKGFHIINLFSQRVSSQPEEQQERLTSRSSSNFKSTASYPTINA